MAVFGSKLGGDRCIDSFVSRERGTQPGDEAATLQHHSQDSESPRNIESCRHRSGRQIVKFERERLACNRRSSERTRRSTHKAEDQVMTFRRGSFPDSDEHIETVQDLINRVHLAGAHLLGSASGICGEHLEISRDRPRGSSQVGLLWIEYRGPTSGEAQAFTHGEEDKLRLDVSIEEVRKASTSSFRHRKFEGDCGIQTSTQSATKGARLDSSTRAKGSIERCDHQRGTNNVPG